MDYPYSEGAGTPAAPTAILIADLGSHADADAAMAAFGAAIVERLTWRDAERLDPGVGRPMLLLEAERVDTELLAVMLPRIDAIAAMGRLPVVVALDEAQIDLAAAFLLRPRVQLLCRPSLAERVAAVAVAAGQTVLREEGEESERARLQQLNAEVARIAEVLARLTGREPGPGPVVGDRRLDYAIPPMGGGEGGRGIGAADVRRAIRARRMRDQFLGDGLFEDPAWDMLLDLFAAEMEGSPVSVSSLCIAAAVAPTTALRWINKMAGAGLLERRPDPTDRRRAFMVLTARARDGMRRYFAALAAAGLTAG